MKFLIFIATLLPLPSTAACNPMDLSLAPSGNLKIFLNYKHSDLTSFGNSQQSRPFPIPLSSEMMARDRTLEPIIDRNTLTYFEPDHRGEWRPCRSEIWWQRKTSEASGFTQRYAATNPYLMKFSKDQHLAIAHRYQYDSNGRIERLEMINFNEFPLKVVAQSCNRYDEKDRLILWISNPTAQVCPKGGPAPNDDWHVFEYGIVNGQEQIILDRWHFPLKKEAWVEQWRVFRPDGDQNSFEGTAKAFGKYGMYKIEGTFIGQRDDNPANSSKSPNGNSRRVEYVFTKPGTPLSVMEDPESLYNYDRRRVTWFDNIYSIQEYFPAGSHVTRHRYFMLAGNAVRNEQFDEKGKLKRIVTVFDDLPLGAWNDAKLPISDKIRPGHKVFHRVYDFDNQGKPKLVALSWNKKFSLKRKIALPDAELVFGTPDGREKWLNIFEFERAFDTSRSGNHVYKEPYNPEAKDEQD